MKTLCNQELLAHVLPALAACLMHEIGPLKPLRMAVSDSLIERKTMLKPIWIGGGASVVLPDNSGASLGWTNLLGARRYIKHSNAIWVRYHHASGEVK